MPAADAQPDLPERGDIVIATVSRIMDHGAYVTLDEYGGQQGFLHISEIAPGWIRSITRYVKPGEKKILLVKRVNPARADIDLSLKQITNDQKKRKLLEVKRYEKGMTLLKSVKERAKLGEKQAAELEDALYSRADSVYELFMSVARNGAGELSSLKLPTKVRDAIVEASSRIRLPSVEIRGILKLSVPTSDGVETIRSALAEAAKKNKEVNITYLGAPRYRISVSAPDFKVAEKLLKPTLSAIQARISKSGTYSFEREESIKVRED